MNAEDADKLFRPEIIEQVKCYALCNTVAERALLFPSVYKAISDAHDDDLSEPILIHYIITALEYLAIHDTLNIAPLFPDIVKIVALVYPDRPDYARTVTKQIIIMISKTNQWIQGL
jgi:hypothetical protein